MIYVLLLLILAVLLFGSSAVLGFIGGLLGFLALFIAIATAVIVFELSAEIVILIIIGIFAICVWIVIQANAQEKRQQEIINSIPPEERERIREQLRREKAARDSRR